MIHFKRAGLLGLAAWGIPFTISFLLFPVKQANAPLFETLMTLTVIATAGVLFSVYFRRRPAAPREALAVGLIWLAINLTMDYPLFAHGPMAMTPAAYYAQIGLDYLTFPLYGLFAARLARHS
jgi:uncharacterized membrane protein YpjA